MSPVQTPRVGDTADREVTELNFTDLDLREREWDDAHGVRYRWINEVWCEWSGREWRPYGLTVYLTAPFTAVRSSDEIGRWGYDDGFDGWDDY